MAKKPTPRVVRDRHEGKLSMPFLVEVPAPKACPRRRKARARAA